MKRNLKRVVIGIFTLLCSLVLLYISFACYLGLSVKNLVYNIYESDGQIKSNHITDPKIIERMNVKHSHETVSIKNNTTDNVREEFDISFMPICLYSFNGGIVRYQYSYKLYVNDDLESGSSNIPVTLRLKFKNFNWYIEEYHEPV